MYSVNTGTYHFVTLKYVPVHTFFVDYVLEIILFLRVCTRKHTFFVQFEPGTYQYILEEKKYEPSTYFVKKVRTRYRPVYVRLYRYHTIAWSIPVCTGMYRVCTTGHDSRCYFRLWVMAATSSSLSCRFVRMLFLSGRFTPSDLIV